ncbi:aminoglycoside phosphotransferase family protein [Streptomyces meridianus]|uniref:Aminoglycoside phosphotransferase family protein n=1 Tax=Streptomyces meridianus TaxID=2938945 RepID=A0ABT0X3F6_9ACTN|nr:aminoglycoside phosphotransferase family protein [Streptomyces meridianus]MCM2577074.1 aminoglycoside phosphotransferase family protein [Streptomyces meridianus]
MTVTKMHADEIETDVPLMRRLLADQHPQWADLPIRRVASHGTDHAIYRIGDRLMARLPRTAGAAHQAAKEAQWLPRLAPHLPLAIPVQLARGRPAEGYPLGWSVYEWLPGENPDGNLDDPDRAADDLAAFVTGLHRIGTDGAPARPRGARGGPLSEGDAAIRRAITELGDRIDGPAALRLWEESLDAPPWGGHDVWVHGDLLPGNLLVGEGRLCAVIDFGCLQVGDPATDLLPAWNLFSGPSRERFRAALAVGDAAWLRGRGWALLQSVVALPYYWDTNPGMVRQASYALAQLLAGSSPAR